MNYELCTMNYKSVKTPISFGGNEFITYICTRKNIKKEAMPEILRIFGLRFYFYSREHEPMHVHVKSTDGKAKFDIQPEGIVLVYNKGMKPKDVKCAEMVLEEEE